MAFFIFCSVIFAMIGLCSTPDYAKILIKKSDYVELSIEEIEEELVSVAIPGGLPEDFFNYGITDKTFFITFSLLRKNLIPIFYTRKT